MTTEEVTQHDDGLDLIARFILKEGIDIVNRIISIDGSITQKSYIKFDRQLALLETTGVGPIDIYINSPGGDVYSMFAYIDRIQSSGCDINTIATGLVASAAIGILAAGDKRFATPHTSFMHHSSSYGAGFDRLSSHDNELKHVKDLEARICKFLAKQTGSSYAFWKGTGKHIDHYFDAEKAKEVGLIHEIS